MPIPCTALYSDESGEEDDEDGGGLIDDEAEEKNAESEVETSEPGSNSSSDEDEDSGESEDEDDRPLVKRMKNRTVLVSRYNVNHCTHHFSINIYFCGKRR